MNYSLISKCKNLSLSDLCYGCSHEFRVNHQSKGRNWKANIIWFITIVSWINNSLPICCVTANGLKPMTCVKRQVQTSNAVGTLRATIGQPRCRNRTASTHSNFLYGRSRSVDVGFDRGRAARKFAARRRRRIFNGFPRKPNSDYQ